MASWDRDARNEYVMVASGAVTAYPTGTRDTDTAEGATTTQGSSLFASDPTTSSITRQSVIKRLVISNSGALATVTLEHHNGNADGASHVIQAPANTTVHVEMGGLRERGWRIVNSNASVATVVVYALRPDRATG